MAAIPQSTSTPHQVQRIPGDAGMFIDTPERDAMHNNFAIAVERARSLYEAVAFLIQRCHDSMNSDDQNRCDATFEAADIAFHRLSECLIDAETRQLWDSRHPSKIGEPETVQTESGQVTPTRALIEYLLERKERGDNLSFREIARQAKCSESYVREVRAYVAINKARAATTSTDDQPPEMPQQDVPGIIVNLPAVGSKPAEPAPYLMTHGEVWRLLRLPARASMPPIPRVTVSGRELYKLPDVLAWMERRPVSVRPEAEAEVA